MSNRKSTPFFAAHGDLVSVLSEVMADRPLDIVASGLFEGARFELVSDISKISPQKTYLVVDQGVNIDLRSISQRDGGEMYAIDELANPHAISLRTGGPNAENHLIAGQVGTVGNCPQAVELYALFARIIRKKFERIKSYYVGPEAAAMLDNGARLSATPRSPQAFDLNRQ